MEILSGKKRPRRGRGRRSSDNHASSSRESSAASGSGDPPRRASGEGRDAVARGSPSVARMTSYRRSSDGVASVSSVSSRYTGTSGISGGSGGGVAASPAPGGDLPQTPKGNRLPLRLSTTTAELMLTGIVSLPEETEKAEEEEGRQRQYREEQEQEQERGVHMSKAKKTVGTKERHRPSLDVADLQDEEANDEGDSGSYGNAQGSLFSPPSSFSLLDDSLSTNAMLLSLHHTTSTMYNFTGSEDEEEEEESSKGLMGAFDSAAVLKGPALSKEEGGGDGNCDVAIWPVETMSDDGSSEESASKIGITSCTGGTRRNSSGQFSSINLHGSGGSLGERIRQVLSASLVGRLRSRCSSNDGGGGGNDDGESSGSAMAAAAEASARTREARSKRSQGGLSDGAGRKAEAVSAAWTETWSVAEKNDSGEDSGELEAAKKKQKSVRCARCRGRCVRREGGRSKGFAAAAALTAILLVTGAAAIVVFLLGGRGEGWSNDPPPPPPDLSSTCAPESPSFSYVRCVALCEEAECCFLPRWHARRCSRGRRAGRLRSSPEQEEGAGEEGRGMRAGFSLMREVEDDSSQDACATYSKLCNGALANQQKDEAGLRHH